MHYSEEVNFISLELQQFTIELYICEKITAWPENIVQIHI
jgi:hypothetical protein